MSRTGTWTVSRSRLPALFGGLFVGACGAASLAAGQGWLWWAGAACVPLGGACLLRAARRPAETLRISIGERVRLEDAAGGVIAEGLLDGGSVVTPWLLALRVRGDGGWRSTDVVLDAGAAPADELRRLRVRLLTDASLRA